MEYIRFYEDRGLYVVKAEGQYVWDLNGLRYLDFHTGHGVAFLGHRNPRIIEALKRQMEEVITAPPSFRVKIRDEMLQILEKIFPNKYTHMAMFNSGSEGVEIAIKLVRKATGRKKLVAFTNSFHGRTLGALSITGNARYRRPFEPLIPHVEIIQYNDVSSLDKIDGETAGVIVEVIQGEGGVIVANKEFIKALKERANSTGALIVIDEVQTGFGRTGKIWGFQHYSIEPDIIVAGKAIGGGFPVSIVATSSILASNLEYGEHGSTFGGNPLACAAVKASVEVFLEDNVLEKTESIGKILYDKLYSTLGEHRL
ncbi:MAG: aminotransferase class III-fold pyridoxal phosphate-dependent enzyme, partial [Acidilobaceae archaeon]